MISVGQLVTADMNSKLTRPVIDPEIKAAVFQLGPLKGPGPYGYSEIFYQKYWDVIEKEVCSAVRSLFLSMAIFRENGTIPTWF